MIRTRQLSALALVLALMVGAGGCTADQPEADQATSDQSFAGHWRSPQWGEHYIVVEGSTAKVIYAHLDGRVVGTVDHATLTGWWTEAPGRQPSAEAGEVVFTISGTGAARTIHGTWRHGTDGADRQDWDLVWVDDQTPADVRAKFDETALFIRHP